MAECADIHVLAPVSPVRYSARPKIWVGTEGIPRDCRDQRLIVTHPWYIYLPLAGLFNAMLLFLQLLGPVIRLRKQFPFQVIDAQMGNPDAVAAALLALVFRCPFTVTLRGSEVEHGQRPLRRFGMRWALRRAGRVFPVSERLRQFAISLGVDPARVTTIPNGVDSKRFFPRNQRACRNKFGVPLDRPVILSVGVLMELKGHHRIVRALKALAGRGVDAVLVIAGSPARATNFEADIRREIADAGLLEKVRLLGHVPAENMPELMSAADVFCLASRREGWPNVVHEALSCGVPVVATNVGAIPEMIPSDDYGLIVPVNDVAALAEALDIALHRTWNQEAIARWGKTRDWSQVAGEALDLMEGLV